MCGIAGFIGNGDVALLGEMTDALRHRGPDARGLWWDAERRIGLGHRRLSIVDLESGDQPMWSADGELAVVFNGEIYDSMALRAQLEERGHRFVSHHSDTEVLLHGYREWGDDFVERLNGMWAFALFDKRRGRLLLSRDRFGKKPLYYSMQRGTFAFGSELKALLRHPDVEAVISRPALRKYFAYGYIPAPHSLYAGVHKLPAGCNLSLELAGGEPKISRYWEFTLEPFDHTPPRAEEQWGEQLVELLDAAVSRRLISDVPLGVFLSGGIDSSAVAGLAARHLPPGELRTFAVGFREASFDESIHAERAAAHVGSRHRCATLSPDAALEVLPEILAGLDEPMGDSSLLPTWLLCREARREVRVALGGDGADELFAGYDPFRALRLAETYDRVLPRRVHQAIRLLAARLPTSHRNISFDFKVKRALAGLSYPSRMWNPVWMGPLEPGQIEELFAEPVDPEELYSEAIECWERCAGESPVDRTLQFFTRLYLENGILAKVDRASMLHGLEVRSPFLDIELVDFVRRIPHRYKLRGGETKYLLKRALEPLLPREILYRKKKGFGVPVGRWFKDGQLGWDTGPAAAGFHAGFRERLLAEHRSGRADHRLYLWSQWLLDHMPIDHA
ncbi:MAG: asparagine synthase (glutamine-hydrolyzing) [Deltaproteobacteria bacterium]|nr:asparagine synthase (glutamine-hydrolyzing) [Deltaproteobacteria bacterium]MBW2418141.1 asparagine synthase (glutamine-hydrolyzing) [Deltaproteobacteria bacterium]